MEKQQNVLKVKVRRLYQDQPKLVNDTKALVVQLMEEYGVTLNKKQQEHFMQMPSVEDMYRRAREARAENDYELARTVAEPVKENRFKRFKFFGKKA